MGPSLISGDMAMPEGGLKAVPCGNGSVVSDLVQRDPIDGSFETVT
jgi:hypothetical protein